MVGPPYLTTRDDGWPPESRKNSEALSESSASELSSWCCSSREFGFKLGTGAEDDGRIFRLTFLPPPRPTKDMSGDVR